LRLRLECRLQLRLGGQLGERLVLRYALDGQTPVRGVLLLLVLVMLDGLGCNVRVDGFELWVGMCGCEMGGLVI